MSLDGLNSLVKDWTLNNSLTIKDATIEGDLTTTGFIYGGGVTNSLLSSNNTWTGENNFTSSLPTYQPPTLSSHMSTKQYVDTTFNNIGNNLLPLNNTFSGSNTFNVLPKFSNNANAGDELVNKATCDNSVLGYTGGTNTNNSWIGSNYFNTSTGDLLVPTPTADQHLANKSYVDNSIVNFNSSGGKVELVEIASSGNTNITCDPTIYSSMIVAMLSGGGYGNLNTTPTAQSIISFGGSGGLLVFKMPAYTGNAVYSATFNTRTTVGFSRFFAPDGTQMFGISNGSNGSSSASGTGGVINYRDSNIGVDQNQIVSGRTEPRQSPITNPTITKCNNICCWNGYGLGGSFNFTTGADVAPTNNYLLLIKFKN